MISQLLRIEMIAAAIGFLLIIVHHVNHNKIRINFMFIWLLIALALLIVAFFPSVVGWLCSLMDVETPANLLYLLGIFTLLWITFHQTLTISKQADQIKRLTQIVSIEKYKQLKEGDHHAAEEENR